METKAVAKHAIIVTVCVIAYLFAMKESSNYSRVVIFAFPIISICVLYIGRILLKKWLSKHRGPASGKRAILLIGGKKNYREIVEAFTSNPYSEFHVMGIGIIDAKENEIPNYHGFPVFCGESAIEDFAQLNWVDEALFSIPTELALPDKMIQNFGIMGITIHIKLARVADDSSNQIVEKLEGYTVLSTSINMVKRRSADLKRIDGYLRRTGWNATDRYHFYFCSTNHLYCITGTNFLQTGANRKKWQKIQHLQIPKYVYGCRRA